MIIFNCVRSNKERDDLIKRLGFLLDERRVNVAITRPRDFLFIIGNRATLSVEKGVWKKVNEGWVQLPNVWFNLINHIEKNLGYYQIDASPDSFDYKKFTSCMEKA